MNLEKNDMQGLIVRGYKSLNAARYILLKIKNAAEAKQYFNFLIKNYITIGDKTGLELTEKDYPKTAVQIAFTSSGLKQLDLPEKIIETFSREFREGMAGHYHDRNNNIINERSTLLGDTERNNPIHWHWGRGKTQVDCMIMLFAKDTTALNALHTTVFKVSQGVEELEHKAEAFDSSKHNIPKEHFGFRDGISQPNLDYYSDNILTYIRKKL